MRRLRTRRLSIPRYRTFVSGLLQTLHDDGFVTSRLATRGWDAEATACFQETYDAFADLAHRFEVLRDTRLAVSQRFRSELNTFRRTRFMDHVDLTRLALDDDPEARELLGVDDGLSNLDPPYRQWQVRAGDFYQFLLERDDLRDALATVHLTPDEIAAGADTVAHLRSLYVQRRNLYADRQQTRRDRDAQRKVVEAHLRRLQSIALPVFRTTSPEHLELFGFTAPS